MRETAQKKNDGERTKLPSAGVEMLPIKNGGKRMM